MTTPIEVVQAQLEALDRRLAGEHGENRDTLKETKAAIEKLDEKVDRLISTGVRQDEQIRTIQRGGGGVLAFFATALGALLVEWVKRGTGGH